MRNGHLVRPILQASVALVVMATCVVPWAVRNKRIFGEYTLSAHGMLNLWMGNHTGTDGGSQVSQNEGERHPVSSSGTTGQECKDGSSGRIRTYDQAINSRPLYH